MFSKIDLDSEQDMRPLEPRCMDFVSAEPGRAEPGRADRHLLLKPGAKRGHPCSRECERADSDGQRIGRRKRERKRNARRGWMRTTDAERLGRVARLVFRYTPMLGTAKPPDAHNRTTNQAEAAPRPALR